MNKFSDPIFTDADKAREYLEAKLWPNGPWCRHCGEADETRIVKVEMTREPRKPVEGKKHRPSRAGLYRCNTCRQQFTVTVGTVFERSKIPLNTWLLATFLLCSPKKGMSAHQLWRMLGFGSYRTAWFMAHRIREALKDGGMFGPLGGSGKVVEADELYQGKRENPLPSKQRGDRPFTKRGKGGPAAKRVVIGLVERGGKTKLVHINHATKESVRDVVVRNASRESALHTDESRLYTTLGEEFGAHRTVHHASGEYVRYEDAAMVTTNTIENVFSVFRRGIHGVYQHCGEAHLHRYLNEFAFRYNHRSGLGVSDMERTDEALKGIEGKRLTYRRIGEAANA
ncbi:MAG TPA: IS1595 family transposase [Gammaproteobacteria bacterium]